MSLDIKKAFIFFGTFGFVFVVLPTILYAILVLWNGGAVELDQVQVPDKPYKVVIYFVPGDATLQQSIQIRLAQLFQERTVATFDRYDSLATYNLIKNERIVLILRDPWKLSNPFDTLWVDLP